MHTALPETKTPTAQELAPSQELAGEQVTTTDTAKPPKTLKQYAKVILLAHQSVELADRLSKQQGKVAIAAAIKAGKYLTMAKEQVGHGSFLNWLEGNLKRVGVRTAQNYMRLANTKHVSFLGLCTSLNQAYIVAGVKRAGPLDKNPPGMEDAEAGNESEEGRNKSPEPRNGGTEAANPKPPPDMQEMFRRLETRCAGMEELYADLMQAHPEMDDYFYDTCEPENVPFPILLNMLRRSLNDAFFVSGPSAGDETLADINTAVSGLAASSVLEDTRQPSKLDVLITPEMTPAEVRAFGFPFLDYTPRELLRLFYELCNLNSKALLQGTSISPRRRFASLATQFFPHFYRTPCIAGGMTAYDAFFNDKYLKRALALGRKYDSPERFTMNSLRSYLKFAYDTRVVSNFNPEVAKMIYDLHGGDGRVYDYAAGWGGRLVGFLSSSAGREYVGVDVNKKNFKAYEEITKLYTLSENDWFSNGPEKSSRVINCPSEDFCPAEYEGYFDLAFSSPAYFATEQYSDDPEQSYLRYPLYPDWRNGFLRKTIANCVTMLNPGGHFVCNIQDVKHKGKTLPLVDDTMGLASCLGLQHTVTYQMDIAPGIGINKEKAKSEPVLVFRKA